MPKGVQFTLDLKSLATSRRCCDGGATHASPSSRSHAIPSHVSHDLTLAGLVGSTASESVQLTRSLGCVFCESSPLNKCAIERHVKGSSCVLRRNGS